MRAAERKSSPPNPIEAGFSFIEILVSMLLSAVLGLVLWSGLSNGEGLVRKTILRSSQAVEILQLDSALRRELERIRVPFWARSQTAVSQEGSILSISWLEGYAERRLSLEVRASTILIGETAGGRMAAFGPFENVRMRLLPDETGRPRGVEISVERGGQPVLIAARFGGNPL